MANLGVIPGSGGISRLTRLVGPHWAKWLVMAGNTVHAAAALQMGLVHAVHPQESFDDEVDKFVQRIAQLPHEAVGVAKLAIDATVSMDRGTAATLSGSPTRFWGCRTSTAIWSVSSENEADRVARPDRNGASSFRIALGEGRKKGTPWQY